MSRTQLLLLGTGTPNCLPQRSQSSLAVIVDGQPYIVDCGGGTIQRISQARHHHQLEALAPPNLTRLFLTHLHPDHTTGLADFIIAPWVLDRVSTLEIYGVVGTQAMVNALGEAYKIGINEHQYGLAPINHELLVNVTEVDGGYVYQDARVRIEAFTVSHGDLAAVGYKFTTADKTIVISGDTCPSPQLVEMARGCDILVHEVYSAEQCSKSRSPAWQHYHRTVHTSTEELAHIANQVRPQLLVLVHQLYWGATDESVLSRNSPLL